MSASISPGSTRCSTSAMVTRPHIAASGLKLRADWRNTRLPCRSPFQARTSPKSATTASSITNSLSPSGVENVRTSFAGEDTVTLPSESYLHGSPPSATWVPTPVAVKNAGIPDPPARIRSASVPWGVSSTSSSPCRYCRANSLFSPTYDEIIRRIRWGENNPPQPPLVDPTFVRPRLELVGPLLQQRVDQPRRDAAHPKTADRDRRPACDVGDRLGRRSDHLVHEDLRTSADRSARRRHPSQMAGPWGHMSAVTDRFTSAPSGYCAGRDSIHHSPLRLGRRTPARGHRQGRHRQVHGRRRPRPCASRTRAVRAAVRGRGPPGHRAAVRRSSAAL